MVLWRLAELLISCRRAKLVNNAIIWGIHNAITWKQMRECHGKSFAGVYTERGLNDGRGELWWPSLSGEWNATPRPLDEQHARSTIIYIRQRVFMFSQPLDEWRVQYKPDEWGVTWAAFDPKLTSKSIYVYSFILRNSLNIVLLQPSKWARI